MLGTNLVRIDVAVDRGPGLLSPELVLDIEAGDWAASVQPGPEVQSHVGGVESMNQQVLRRHHWSWNERTSPLTQEKPTAREDK